MKIRFKIIIYFLLVLMAALVLRLYFLQVMSGEVYAEMASESITREKSILAPRGNIYDRDGRLLVKSIPVSAVAVEPYLVAGDENTIQMLSDSLEMPVEDIKKKLDESNVSYLESVILKIDIDPSTMIYLKEYGSRLPGVEVIDIFLREYKYDYLASHILGYTGEIDPYRLSQEKYRNYVGGDQIGLTGIEEFYEYQLSGEKGKIVYEVDPEGRPVSIIEETGYTVGNDLYLTIDIEIQKAVEELLYEGILAARSKTIRGTDENYNVPAGAVVVLDAKNGEVLSMASYPTYDPGLFVGGIGEQDWDELNDPLNHNPLNNRAVMSFAPGSIFKIITAYAGLSENVISRESRIFCSGIWLGLGEEFPRWCWAKGGHGSLEILGGIKNSCDVFFYEIGYRLFSKSKNIEELLQKYSRIFGLDSPTGIDLPFEDSGIIPDKQWKKEYFKDRVEYSVWFPGDTVSMAIGQGDILVSPLQMAMVYSTLANRGIQYRPHLIKEIKDYMGNLYTDGDIEEYKDLDLDENYIDLIEKGFQLVVGPGGTAAYSFRNFPIRDISVAGKTSTTEVYGKQNYAWFASYAPVGNPKYVIVVFLEEGGGGGSNAAPIVEKIYRYLFNLD